MLLGALITVAATLAGIASTISWKRRAARPGELAAIARRHGWSHSTEDGFASTRVPFALFRQGDGADAENVVWGATTDGVPFRVFDLDVWRWVEQRRGLEGELGGRDRTHQWFTCALVELPGVLPHLGVTPETLGSRALQGLGLRDIEVESAEFNRTFQVWCDDERFAHAFLDPLMVELLLGTRGELRFEVRGRWALVAAPLLPPAQWPGLAGLLAAFRERIPRVVWSMVPELPEQP